MFSKDSTPTPVNLRIAEACGWSLSPKIPTKNHRNKKLPRTFLWQSNFGSLNGHKQHGQVQHWFLDFRIHQLRYISFCEYFSFRTLSSTFWSLIEIRPWGHQRLMTWLHLWHFGLWGSCLMHLLSNNFSGPCQCHLPHLHSGRWLSSPIPSWGKRIHESRTSHHFWGVERNHVIFQGMIPIFHISSPTIFNCVTASRCYVNSQIRLLFAPSLCHQHSSFFNQPIHCCLFRQMLQSLFQPQVFQLYLIMHH